MRPHHRGHRRHKSAGAARQSKARTSRPTGTVEVVVPAILEVSLYTSYPPTTEARDGLLRIRLSAPELELIDARADRVGLHRSAYVREVLLASEESRRRRGHRVRFPGGEPFVIGPPVTGDE